MNVFITGSTGWVGSAIVEELLGAGHKVIGLARSRDKAAILSKMGATLVYGTLDDHDVLRDAASKADAVIHTAFNHDFSKFAENAEQDRSTIELLGSVLQGSQRPLIVTNGFSGFLQGKAIVETDVPVNGLRKSETAAKALLERNIHVVTVRLSPSVHGIGEHGFVSMLIKTARMTGVSAYIAEGKNCWAGVHRLDAAKIYRLALESGVTECVYHAVADERVEFKDIATAIGQQLGLPVEMREKEHFGALAHFVGIDMFASSQHTREILGWKPTGPTLINDLEQAEYYME